MSSHLGRWKYTGIRQWRELAFCPDWNVLQFNLVRVEIHELRPEVVTEDNDVLVHYQSRTNVG